jgi:hypothetical protein
LESPSDLVVRRRFGASASLLEPIERTLASALKDTIRRAFTREIQKTMRRVRRLQRQVMALRPEARAQRRLIAAVDGASRA